MINSCHYKPSAETAEEIYSHNTGASICLICMVCQTTKYNLKVGHPPSKQESYDIILGFVL